MPVEFACQIADMAGDQLFLNQFAWNIFISVQIIQVHRNFQTASTPGNKDIKAPKSSGASSKTLRGKAKPRNQKASAMVVTSTPKTAVITLRSSKAKPLWWNWYRPRPAKKT